MNGIKRFIIISIIIIAIVAIIIRDNIDDDLVWEAHYPGSEWTANDTISYYVAEEKKVRFEVVEPRPDSYDLVHQIIPDMFGEIKYNGVTYKCFFVFGGPDEILAFSEDMPTSLPDGSDYYYTEREYRLALFLITSYRNKKHFVVEVYESKIFEAGTRFDFYRTDS